jgi:hypothetical protein
MSQKQQLPMNTFPKVQSAIVHPFSSSPSKGWRASTPSADWITFVRIPPSTESDPPDRFLWFPFLEGHQEEADLVDVLNQFHRTTVHYEETSHPRATTHAEGGIFRT